jgi:hypothetical protein
MSLRMLSAFLGGLLLFGCGGPKADYGQLDLVKAGGTVTLDGQPLADAVVSFDASDGQFSYGLTDAGGHYSLQVDSEMKGVTPGEKTVRISTTRKILGLNASEGASEADPATQLKADEKVPEKYNKNSELKITVGSDKTTYDFDLKSK